MKTKLFYLFLLLLIAYGAKAQVNLQTGLIAYYPFNCNANDESGNGNNGTVNGATLTTDRFGNVGKAYSFNGNSSFVELPSAAINNMASGTVSVWFKTNNISSTTALIDKTITSVNNYFQLTVENAGVLQLNINDCYGCGTGFNTPSICTTNIWTNVIIAWNGSTQTVYVNGVSVQTVNQTSTVPDVNKAIYIGKVDNNTAFFNGNIDDIRIYNRAFSVTDITQLYNSEKPATDLTTGLVAYYPFNGNANDESGNGNNGTVNGATLTTDRFGNVGKAYSFDGKTNNINITKTFFDNGWPNYTISGWFYSANVSGSSQVLCNTNPSCGFDLTLNHDLGLNKLGFGINSNPPIISWDVVNFESGTSIFQNKQWNFFTFIKEGDNYKLYINGSIEKNANGTKSPISYLCSMYIGIQNNNGYSNGFNGKLDDYRIYNRPLSSDEVTQLYNSEKPATDLTTGLVAYYPFNGNANDESGNGNNGTVNGATLTTDRFGNVGKAFRFDGSSNSITSNTSCFNIGWDQFTVSGWFSLDDANKLSQTIFNTIPHTGVDLNYNYETTAQHNFSAFIGSYSGVPAWDIALNNQGSKKDYENNKWVHFTLIKNGLKYYLYVNNILDMIITSSITPSNILCKISLGSNNVRPEFFYGTIDDVRIYNRALSSDEVTQLYNSEKPATDLTTGLVAYYPFNGNANDESGNGNNGTVNGATLTTDRFGNVGKAYGFDGVSNNISFSKIPMQNTDNWCISSWVNAKSLNTIQTILLLGVDNGNGGNSSLNGYSIGTGITGTLSSFVSIFSDIAPINSGSDLSSNQWYSLIIQRVNGVTNFYINGIKTNSASTVTPRTPTEFFIGSSTGIRYFNGKIDDVRIYNRPLSSDEITDLYNSEKPATDLTTGLVAYYPFNGNANDESGNGNNGTVNGATLTTDRFGNVGKAYYFNGSNNISLNKPFLDGAYTLSLWIKVMEKQSYAAAIFTNGILHGNFGNGFSALISPDNNIILYEKHPFSNGFKIYNETNPITPNNNYNQYTFVWDGKTNNNSVKVYYNGTLILSGACNSNLINASQNLVFGYGSDGGTIYPFKGYMDDIRIYNRALSEEEIKFLYSGQQTLRLDAPTDIQYRTTKISNSTNTKTTLIWKSVTGAKIYEVYKDGVLLGKTFSTIFYDENPEGNYKYQIASVNASGKSPLSLPCNVSVSGTNTVAGYGSLAIYITDANKQKVENALIQFTDGSTAQTLKTGFVLLKNIAYGTTKTISRIVKSGWDFAPLNGSSFSCSKSKPSMVLKYLATPTPENEPTMETFNPQYSSDLVIVSDGDITLPTFTKGQDFTLDMKIASTSQYWWNGNIRLKAVRKNVEVGKTYPTYYIAQLNDVKVPMEGKMIRFTANASQLNAEAGNYELYVEAQTKEVFRQGYFILKKGKVAASTTNSDTQYKTDISVSDNTDLATEREALFMISDEIKKGHEVYKIFGKLIEWQSDPLDSKIVNELHRSFKDLNKKAETINKIIEKIQFLKDMSDLVYEKDEIIRSFKAMKMIVELAAKGDPMATVFKSYLDVAVSMKGAVDRICTSIYNNEMQYRIGMDPMYIQIEKDWNKWDPRNYVGQKKYFKAEEFIEHISSVVFFTEKDPSNQYDLGKKIDSEDPTRILLDGSSIPLTGFGGLNNFLKITFINKRVLTIPINSDFIDFLDVQPGKANKMQILFKLGTNTNDPKQIVEKFKIIEP
jgi:hypothetical protein